MNPIIEGETGKHRMCEKPFEEIEINPLGDVFFCCPIWNNNYSIGNIFETPIIKIWNSPKAVELRKKVLQDDYSLCNTETCCLCKEHWFEFKQDFYQPFLEQYPKYIKLVYDKECNIACKFCRNEIFKYSYEDLDKLNKKFLPQVLSIAKQAKIIYLTGNGEALASRHSRLLIKEILKNTNTIKFDIQTNGILCNENNFKTLNLTEKNIFAIRITLNATTAKTYSKIVKNGENYFNIIINNLKFLKELQKKDYFKIFIHFVVYSDNYYEIPDFLQFAKNMDIDGRLWEFREEQCIYKTSENLNIVNPQHPLHQNLINVLNNNIVKEYRDKFSPKLQALIPQ
jgi:radical SAM protein with 4Fe4S-binding SPASM domain